MIKCNDCGAQEKFNFFSDPAFPSVAMLTVLSGFLLKRILTRIASQCALWKAPQASRQPQTTTPEVLFDPIQSIESSAVRNRFVEMNKTWLISKLDRVLDEDAMRNPDIRSLVQTHYDNLRQLQARYSRKSADFSPIDDSFLTFILFVIAAGDLTIPMKYHHLTPQVKPKR
jgi:hypothetical protein